MTENETSAAAVANILDVIAAQTAGLSSLGSPPPRSEAVAVFEDRSRVTANLAAVAAAVEALSLATAKAERVSRVQRVHTASSYICAESIISLAGGADAESLCVLAV